MIKKIIFAVLALVAIAGGVFYITNSKSNYDASKYSASVTPSLSNDAKVDFILPDQFDIAHTLSANTKTIVLSFAKESSHVVRNFLKTQSDDFLEKRDMFYIADISPMPTVILNAFAMPDLKQSSYPVILMYEDKIASKFRVSDKKDSIMIIKFQNKTITEIKYATNESELESILL